MKTLAAILVTLVLVVTVVPVQGDDDVQALRAYFEKAVAQEIQSCLKKSALQTSSSESLRRKGHREASKALFLANHRELIVDRMVASHLEPKGYQVDWFLNNQFNCGCYASWAAK